jgi:hypothetical protein
LDQASPLLFFAWIAWFAVGHDDAPAVSFYVWLRALTGQRLIDLH